MILTRPILTYYPLHERVKAFSSTRKGGVSVGKYGEFNINAYCGDDPEAIATNRQLLCQELQIDTNFLLMPHQTHGDESRIIAQDFFSSSSMTREMLLESVDSLITNVPGVCIGVLTADCIPILLYDDRHHVAAAVHAGWRGTVQRIVSKTIKKMGQNYGTHAEDLHGCIGPGISLTHFEVGDEVYKEFAHAGFNLSEISLKKEKWHINLPECNRLQMVEMGVPESNILNTQICTFDHVDEYFSARRMGIQSGRVYSGIILL